MIITEKRAELKRLFDQGLSMQKIADRLGYKDRKSAADAARKMGLRMPTNRQRAPEWTEAEIEQAKAMKAAGVTITDIAAHLRRGFCGVRDKLNELRLAPAAGEERRLAMVGMTRRCQCGCGSFFTITSAEDADDPVSPMCRARGRKAMDPGRSEMGCAGAMCAA